MEFKRRGDNSQPEWFKLMNGNPSPVKVHFYLKGFDWAKTVTYVI